MDQILRRPRHCQGSGDPALFLLDDDDDDDDDGGDGVGDSDEEDSSKITMGRWGFIPSSKDDVSVERVARSTESSVGGSGLLGQGGDKEGIEEEAVKYVVDDDIGCRIIGRSISLIPSIRRCSKRVWWFLFVVVLLFPISMWCVGNVESASKFVVLSCCRQWDQWFHLNHNLFLTVQTICWRPIHTVVEKRGVM